MPKANGQPTRAERSAANKAAFAAQQRAPRVVPRVAPAKVQAVAPPPAPAGWRVKSPPPAFPAITPDVAARICALNERVAAALQKAPKPSRHRSEKAWEKAETFNGTFEPLADALRKELDATVPPRGHAFHQSAPCGADKTYEAAWEWLSEFHDPGEDY